MCKDLNCMCYDDHSECAARIRELEAEIVERRMDYGEDCKRLDARIAELERLTAMSVESLAYIRGIAKKGGGEEVPDSASTHQAILGYVMFMEQQLAAMTAERDSESRWAKKYSDEADELRQQLAAAQEREAAYAEYKRKLEAIVMWLERNEQSVFARGLWDVLCKSPEQEATDDHK